MYYVLIKVQFSLLYNEISYNGRDGYIEHIIYPHHPLWVILGLVILKFFLKMKIFGLSGDYHWSCIKFLHKVGSSASDHKWQSNPNYIGHSKNYAKIATEAPGSIRVQMFFLHLASICYPLIRNWNLRNYQSQNVRNFEL